MREWKLERIAAQRPLGDPGEMCVWIATLRPALPGSGCEFEFQISLTLASDCFVDWSFSSFREKVCKVSVESGCGKGVFEILVLRDRKSLSSLPVSAWWACPLPSWCIARVGMGILDKRASHVFDSPGNFMCSTIERVLNGVLFSCHDGIPKKDSWLDCVPRRYKSELMAEIGWWLEVSGKINWEMRRPRAEKA